MYFFDNVIYIRLLYRVIVVLKLFFDSIGRDVLYLAYFKIIFKEITGKKLFVS